jgi:hypothetical protein
MYKPEKITYSAVGRKGSCGHQHKSRKAAQKCADKSVYEDRIVRKFVDGIQSIY